jgi:hypothetical protein
MPFGCAGSDRLIGQPGSSAREALTASRITAPVRVASAGSMASSQALPLAPQQAVIDQVRHLV